MHIYVIKHTTIGSDNGLSRSQRQAIIWTNYGIWLIQPLGTNLSQILVEIHIFFFKKMHLKCWHFVSASMFELTKDTTYLSGTVELKGVYCEY